VTAGETCRLAVGSGQARGLFQPFDAQKCEERGCRWPPETPPLTTPKSCPRNQSRAENVESQIECVAEKVAGELRGSYSPQRVCIGDRQQRNAEQRPEYYRREARRSRQSGRKPASICARRGSKNGGKDRDSPKCAETSSVANPGPSVAISNKMPFGSRK